MSTNHELARAAFVLLARYSVGNVSPTDFEGAVKIISDTYAEPMAELERLRRQIELVKNHTYGIIDAAWCDVCKMYEHMPDCPHAKEET